MIERGDSVLFLQASEPHRATRLTLRRQPTPISLHRDSVRIVIARLEDTASNAAASSIGGLLFVALLTIVLLTGRLYPFYY